MSAWTVLLVLLLGHCSAMTQPPPTRTSRLYTELSPFRSLLNGNGNSEWLNFGLWPTDDAVEYPIAAAALADAVSEAAGVQARDRVLEAGGGRGDNAIRLVRHFDASKVVGINFSERETAAALRRISLAGLSHCVRLRCGDASRELPALVKPCSVDRVVAVDCAYHFCTRRTFLEASASVLRPGGGLALADVVSTGSMKDGLFRGMALQVIGFWCGIPPENLVSAGELEGDLTAAGFSKVRIVDITDQVLGGFSKHLRGKALQLPGPSNLVALALSGAIALLMALGQLRYVIVRGSRGVGSR